MAVIGTASGVFLTPGVSANGRLYTAAHIAGAVETMRGRMDGGGLPLTMLSSHGAGDDSTQITGHITAVALDEQGAATFEADIVDTQAGRDILAAVDGGALDSVSIRGFWTGPVRTFTHQGRQVTTAEGLEVDGIDWTKTPGVSAARLSASTRAQESTSGRVAVFESAPPPTVHVTDEAAGRVDAARSALEAFLRVSGYAGSSDVAVTSFVPNADVATAAQDMAAAFQAAITVLDPDDEEDDLGVFQTAPTPAAPVGENTTTPLEGSMPEKTKTGGNGPAAAADESRENTPTPAAAEESGNGGNPQATTLAEADMTRLADMVADRLSRGNTPPATPAAETESRGNGLDEAAVTKVVGAEVAGLAETLAEKVAEAVKGAKDDIRRELTSAGIAPARAGLVATAEKLEEKPLHEMTPDERKAAYETAFTTAFERSAAARRP